MIRDELDRLLDDLLGDDPRRALRAYRNLADEQLPWLEKRVVALARRDHLSWALIGRLLGRSRQATRQRFAVAMPVIAPVRRESHFERTLRLQDEALARLLAGTLKPGTVDDDDPVAW